MSVYMHILYIHIYTTHMYLSYRNITDIQQTYTYNGHMMMEIIIRKQNKQCD